MRNFKVAILFGILVGIDLHGHGQSIDDLVSNIASINEVQYFGQTGKLENYKNFELLISKCDTIVLLQLSKHKNPVVATYASFGLAKKGYQKLPDVFSYFQRRCQTVRTMSGCISDIEPIENQLYYFYKNSLEDEQLRRDLILKDFEKLILENPKRNPELVTRIMKDRNE